MRLAWPGHRERVRRLGPAPVGSEAQFRVLAEMIPQLVWRSLNDER